MRTWQELTDAALETGTFADYQGDGFTVPWQVFSSTNPPIGFTLWMYKNHLDGSYFAASKLHDWCYTPYGSLISVTRPEADLAIRDQIRAIGGTFADIDAGIVYLAVDLGGAQYFGTSQTGFNQGVYLEAVQRLSGIISGPNIPSAGAETNVWSHPFETVHFYGDPSMSIKVVIVFQQVTTKGGSYPNIGLAGREHIGGWTEHVWWGSDSVDQLMQALTANFAGQVGLLPQRARCLCNNATILGVRLYQGGAGKGQFRAAGFPGSAGPGDIPQMALLCYHQLTGNPTPKRLILRGLPDAVVIGGEYVTTTGHPTEVFNYGQSLANFGGMASDVVATFPVFTVSVAGLVTLNNVNNPFAVGNVVTFRNVVSDVTGQRNGGEFVVSSVGPMNNQFSVTDWSFGPSNSGDVRQPTSSVYQFAGSGLTVSRIVTRKVGRPFELYRGRRSKKRPAA